MFLPYEYLPSGVVKEEVFMAAFRNVVFIEM